MQGLAAKFKGKKKEEKEEEKEKEAEGKGLLSEDGDEEEEEDEEDDDDDEEEDDEDDDDAVAGPAVEGSYDAAEWDHLEVFRSTNHPTSNQSNTLFNRRNSKTLISSSTRCQRKRRSCLNTSTGVPVTNIRNNSKARVFQAHDLAFKLKPYTEYTFILEEIHKKLPKAPGATDAQP